ncbi:hypothetical protein KU306_16255 (plasmid) [Haloferax larsenii]|uniref:CARDB protein n=1 Tax=Haloferax larsenii TaxID=302484 RepID=A0ABY5RJ35_HALLR|nr:hypothetical protein [Haloferax larsenii]UVE52164.1 hypothetical protein KU306_16255 [Haloferax larsenii]
MSPKLLDGDGSPVAPWFLAAVIVLSTAAAPLLASPAAANGAHIGITDVQVTPDEPAPGQQTELSVSIRNGQNSPSVVDVTDIYVRRPGSSDDITRVEDVGTIPVGENISVPLPVSFDKSGVKDLRVVFAGRLKDGSHVRVRYPLTVDVREPTRPQVELSVEEAVPGATRSVNVTVANGIDRDIRQLKVVSSSADVNFTVNERVKAKLAAGKAVTFDFPARVSEAGQHPVNLTLHYVDRGVHHEISRTYHPRFTSPTNPGKIVLTDVRATQTGGTLEVSATAGNVGSSSVKGVVVEIPDTERVDRSNYFVGSIEDSDFSSFTLKSDVEGNVSSVPVEVSYTVGGVQKSFTTEVDVSRRAVRRPAPQQGGGLPLLPVGGAASVLLVGAVVYLWRR